MARIGPVILVRDGEDRVPDLRRVGRDQVSVLTFGRKTVNKAELIEALAARLGDRKTATAAL